MYPARGLGYQAFLVGLSSPGGPLWEQLLQVVRTRGNFLLGPCQTLMCTSTGSKQSAICISLLGLQSTTNCMA